MWPRNRIIAAGLLFITAYCLMVFLWLHVNAYYGMAVTSAGAHLSALATGCLVDKLYFQGGRAVCNFLYQAVTVRGPAILHLQVVLHVSNYSYNIPLTLSLAAALFPFVSWKARSLLEALGLLVLIHLFYVFLFCGMQIYHALIRSGVKALWKSEAFAWEYPWVFVNAMAIRFEPFLIGAFIWFRNATSPLRASEIREGLLKG